MQAIYYGQAARGATASLQRRIGASRATGL